MDPDLVDRKFGGPDRRTEDPRVVADLDWFPEPDPLPTAFAVTWGTGAKLSLTERLKNQKGQGGKADSFILEKQGFLLETGKSHIARWGDSGITPSAFHREPTR